MNGQLALTEHAAKRLQQRGIRPEAVDLLMSYGTTEFDHRGASIYHFDKKSRRRLERELGPEAARQLERLTGLYAVVAEDGKVITAGHRHRRILNDRKAAPATCWRRMWNQ